MTRDGKKIPQVESLLWSTANVVKFAIFLIGTVGGLYAILYNQEKQNAKLMSEIQSLREDLNVYVAEAKGKNDLQDLIIAGQTADIAEMRAQLAQLQSREGTKPKPITIESE